MALLSEAGCSDPGNSEDSYAGDLSRELEEGDGHTIESNVMATLPFTRYRAC
jgi:hypothetical protein